MDAAPTTRMTFEEFLAWEEGQDLRHEFDGVRAIAMTGGTASHSAIQSNLAFAMVGRLRGTRCRFYGSDLKVDTSGKARYPDGMVICKQTDGRATIVSDPVVVFEILRKNTAGTDRIVKNHEYEQLPSVQRYVMLEQDRVAATVFSRAGVNWVGQILSRDGVLSMPEIGIEVPLSELYVDVDPLLENSEDDPEAWDVLE